MSAIQVVWFKRDLRVYDHAPLAEAARRGPVLPLYIAEPGLWAQPDAAARHWAFISESLHELTRDLAALGQPLVVRVGEAPAVLDDLIDRFPIAGLWSHEETGNGWTYERDKAVARLLRARGIPWKELPQTGVVRRLKDRDGWSRTWEARMGAPLVPPPRLAALTGPLAREATVAIPDAQALGLDHAPCPGRQKGGRREAESLLQGFLTDRGQRYRKELSSPVTAFDACSRLSPHLAYGTLSMRELVQATRLRRAQVAKLPPGPEKGAWPGALSAFEGRLHWHCHFIQKLESEPRIEWENMQRACDGLRPDEPDLALLDAWRTGQTGFPLVDACMRALHQTGWINFRMRAMLVSFSAYQLWQHWREPGLHLARCFTDYEPGIHWPQLQMQSGTTGINTLRIYNPVKQSRDQDPEGVFIRRWVGELAEVPTEHIHEPWRMPDAEQARAGCRIARDYPAPIVDHEATAREARRRIQAVRRTTEARAQGREVFREHGSRRRNRGAASNKPRRTSRE